MKNINCPCCGGELPPSFIHWAAARLSGFSTLKGESKARSSESASKAARARWAKVRAAGKKGGAK